MNTQHFVARRKLDTTADDAFHWHSRHGAVDRLIPPWDNIEVVRREGGIAAGGAVELRGRVGPIPIRWIAEHETMIAPREFSDRQVSGPFAAWRHVHRFLPDGSSGSLLEDSIEYRIPGGPAGRLLAGPFVRRQLERMFHYRHETTAGDLALHRRTPMTVPQTVAVAGSSGLVGSALIPLLTTGGHRVRRLVRGRSAEANHEICWDPSAGRLDPADLEGVDAVIHLGGENIASGRWTEKKRKRIRDSRVVSTRLLADALARMQRPPKVLLCASATGFYGDRGDESLTEESAPGQGFLADVCQAWEQAADPAREVGIRVANLRFGMILSPKDGALRQMLPLFRFGLGGRLGSGTQVWSWIGIDDAIGAIYHVLANDQLTGPINLTAPDAVTNRRFTAVLSKVLHRPAIIPAPSAALRLALGAMADELLLTSARVLPKRLLHSDYVFRHANLESALRHLLGRQQ